MKVFLVRHGVTLAAEEKKGQAPDSPLSEEGIRQARAAAKRLLREDINVVLASKWKRAHETAEIIASELKKEIELFEGIHEKERGVWSNGASYYSDVAKEHDVEVQKNWQDLDWKFKGEGESVREVIQRASRLRDHLIAKHKDQNVLVVSHSAFIRSFICSAILAEDATDLDTIKLWTTIPISNTGITLMEYGTNDMTHDWIPWRMVYFNDHLHLRD
jgi:broad specificity phosphatase PhoE